MKLQELPLSKIEQEIFDRIEEYVVLNGIQPLTIYLEGGHFDPRKKVDAFAVNTLRFSLNVANNLIYKHKKKVRLVLGILVNNIGFGCDTDSCDIGPNASNEQETVNIPEELQEVLNAYAIYKSEKLIISNEVNLKNRGIRTLRKNLDRYIESKQISLESGETAKIYHIDDGDNFLLAEESSGNWTAKCTTIMGQHYADLFLRLHQRFPENKDFMLVDFSEMFDKHKVGSGKKACFSLFLKPELTKNNNRIMNVFQWDTEGMSFSIDN